MEREYDVEITTQAQEQMREIGAYIKNTLGMPEAAKKTLKKLEKGISLLSFMPEMAPLLDEEPWHSKGV